MRLEWSALELWVELDTDEPGVVGAFDDLGKLIVGRHSREDQARFLKRVAIVDVDLIAVSVPLANRIGTVDRTDLAVSVELGRIGSEPHRTAEVTPGGALLKPLLAHPLGDQADDRLRRIAELGCRSVGDAPQVSRTLDAGHLHPKADSEEGNFPLASKLHRGNLAFAPALAEPAGNEDPMQRFELGNDVGLGMLEDLSIDPLDLDLRAIGYAAVDQCLAQALVGVGEPNIFANNTNRDL